MSIETDPTRTTQGTESEYDIDSGASEVQRGHFKKPQFFGDNSMSAHFTAFSSAVAAAASFGGASSYLVNDLTDQRTDEDSYWRLTVSEYDEIRRKASSMASFGNIPYDVAEDFLVILCYINRLDDMILIADTLQIPELADSTILRKPFLILAVPGLEKAAYLASAVEGLINLFRKYLNSSQYTPTTSGESMDSILQNLGAMASGLGGGAGIMAQLESGTSDSAMGNFLSELVLEKRIPMSVIAKNPNMQSPSYTGKAFFGESPTALSLVDMKAIFAKKIGCFPKPSNGSGTTSFSLQNMGSLAGGISIQGLISKMNFGSTSVEPGTKKFRQISAIGDQLNSLTGARLDETVDVRRADTAIPLMSALSAISAGEQTSPFNADTFKSGWTQANGVSNHLQNNGSSFLEAMRRFL